MFPEPTYPVTIQKLSFFVVQSVPQGCFWDRPGVFPIAFDLFKMAQ